VGDGSELVLAQESFNPDMFDAKLVMIVGNSEDNSHSCEFDMKTNDVKSNRSKSGISALLVDCFPYRLSFLFLRFCVFAFANHRTRAATNEIRTQSFA